MSLLHKLVRLAYPMHSVRRVRRGPLTGWKFIVAPGFGLYYALGSKALHVDILSTCIKPGNLVFDVGANRGHVSLILSQAVGSSGRVVAFEPVEELCEDLRRNLALNKVENVTVCNTALGAREGRIEFLYSSATSTQGKFAGAELGLVVQGAELIQVNQSPMDLFANQYGVPDCVKIDVEGAAGHVLRGASQTIDARKTTFFIELHGPEEQDAVQSLLIDKGYEATDCNLNPVPKATQGWHSPLIIRPAAR